MVNWVKDNADILQFNIDSYTEPEIIGLVAFLRFHKWHYKQCDDFTTTYSIYK